MEDDQWANWRFLLSSTAIELFEHYGVSLHDEAHWTPRVVWYSFASTRRYVSQPHAAAIS